MEKENFQNEMSQSDDIIRYNLHHPTKQETMTCSKDLLVNTL